MENDEQSNPRKKIKEICKWYLRGDLNDTFLTPKNSYMKISVLISSCGPVEKAVTLSVSRVSK